MSLTLIKNKFKTKIDIHDKRVVLAVSEAIARTRVNDVTAKDCRNDARTVVSAWILGQSGETAAQRLLTWWCIDCGINVIYLEHEDTALRADERTAGRVMSSAMAGYFALEAIEKYGKHHLPPQSEYRSSGPVVSAG